MPHSAAEGSVGSDSVDACIRRNLRVIAKVRTVPHHLSPVVAALDLWYARGCQWTPKGTIGVHWRTIENARGSILAPSLEGMVRERHGGGGIGLRATNTCPLVAVTA